MEDLGNPDIEPFRTLQTSAGVEQRFGEFVKVDLEGFYKRWENRIVGTEGGAPPRFVNDGRGRAYGLEALLDVRPSRRTQGFLAYTLSRSQRQDGDDPWRPFDYDQTHNLSLAANYDLGAGWLVGARFRYVTGNPTSEIESAVYDASTDTYHPLVREVNGARQTAFHQLDVRVEKKFDIGVVDLTTFLEVLNVYNAKNQEGESYSFDYSESEGVTGMPIFPNLGIRGEL
jgi:outer membrane receptor protein involved in Fe transport